MEATPSLRETKEQTTDAFRISENEKEAEESTFYRRG